MGALCCRAAPVDFDGDVNLFHFSLLRCVGKGAFGKVRVVQHKQTREMYALKYINKHKCVKMKAVANIIQERRLLEEIDHPFIVNLRYAFQDDENCFFVLDLMLGGDLRFHLERLGCLPEGSVRFYVAQLASALTYLHESHIMHRDIKPDNILLDERGNAHVTDFNIAVHFNDRRMHTGVAGSLAYMAPEILAKRGYTYTIDWWSLGVCAYELLFGRRPFRGKSNAELTYSISKDHLKFPEDYSEKCSRAGMQVVKGLLERRTVKRLGCKPNGEGFREFSQLPWFENLDWAELEAKRLPTPFVPDSKKANFDASVELEELLLEDNPLKAKQRKVNQDNLSPEMKQMEVQFIPYDFKKMQRRSYFPVNEQTTSTITATSSNESRPVTPAQFGDVAPDSEALHLGNGSAVLEHYHADADSIHVEKVSEKETPQ